MRAWATKKIGDVCEIMTGGTPSKAKPEYFEGGRIKWLVSGDIHQKEITECSGRITRLGLENSNAKYLPVNSVMMALNGQGKTRGTVALLRTEATCNQSMVSIYPKDPTRLLPEYVYANLYGRYQEIRRITGDDGNDRRGLNMTLVRNIEIPIAPIEQQERIVAILDEAIAAIATATANAGKNLANARELFESELNRVFSKEGEGWVEVKLGTIVNISHGYAFKGSTFGKADDESKPIVLTPGNYTENATLEFNRKNTKRLSAPIPEGFLFDVGDLTVVMTDLSSKMKILGKPAFVDRPNILHNQRIGRLLFTDDSVLPRFVFYYLRTRPVSDAIRATATGTMVRHTAPKRILSNSMGVPGQKNEQRRVIAQLDGLNDQCAHLESAYHRKLTLLTELKQSILNRAFTGELTADFNSADVAPSKGEV